MKCGAKFLSLPWEESGETGVFVCSTGGQRSQKGGFTEYFTVLKLSVRRWIMANPFVHIELHTQDPEKAKEFYGKLFDWTLEDYPDMNYTIIKVGEGTGGGMMKSPMPDAMPQWVPYVLVNDIAASTEKAKSLGATILLDVTEIPDMGWFSMLLDPTGAAFALWKPKMAV